MGIGRAVVLNVVQQSVGNLNDGLVGHMLVGPGLSHSQQAWPMRKRGRAGFDSLDTELDATESLGQLVDKLLLDGIVNCGRHGYCAQCISR